MKFKFQFSVYFCLSLLCSAAQAFDYDPDIGAEINDVCAGCHGEFGEGGKEGEYPRLAGMPAAFIGKQLVLFRERKRPNMPMLQYIDERQMPDEEVYHISRYLAEIKLNTRLPPVDETAHDFNAYDRLLESKKLMQIPRAEGDVEEGLKLYKKECASCHGSDGYGRHDKGVPLLAGQYTSYLWNQVEKLRKRIRIHDEDDPKEELLDDFTDAELTDIFAWLSTADD
jgi:cytochrome c553